MVSDIPVIVSMTSYPKRISNVAYSVWLILTKQIIKPDSVHIYLAKGEFPHLYDDLPLDLRLITKMPNVFLHWTDKNTYCFKRHNIFIDCNHDKFLCFMIDDDVYYPNTLISSSIALHNKYPNAIINYTDYGQIYYRNQHQSHKVPSYKRPTPNNRWCGQSMIPSWVYPMDAFEPNYIALRDKYCPVCDETWMTQFFIKHNIGIINNSLPWGRELNHHNCNAIGIVQKVHKLDQHGMNFRDRCLVDLFKYVFPENRAYYARHFNYGKA